MGNIEFKKVSDEPLLSYQIIDQDKNEIGHIEGFVNTYGHFLTVIKIFDDKYRNSGIGFIGFKMLFDELNKKTSIVTILGGWSAGGEFADYENGMSTNLKVFNENIQSGYSPEEAALATPTGKWSQRLGFTNVEIRCQSEVNVEVSFHKSDV